MKITRDEYIPAVFSHDVVILCGKAEDKINIMTLAWFTPISFNPPMIGIAVSEKRYTYNLIEKSKEFSLSFLPPTRESIRILNLAGSTSGKNTDKINQYNIKLEEGFSISTPHIKDSILVVEAKVEKIVDIGDHKFIAGKIVTVAYDENFFGNYGTVRPERYKSLFWDGEENILVKILQNL